MAGDKTEQLFVRLAVDRGRLELSEPGAAFNLLKRADAGVRLDLHGNDSGAHFRKAKGSGVSLMTDSLDVVAIGADDECSIVVCMVVRAQARGAVVSASRSHGLEAERVDLDTDPRG